MVKETTNTSGAELKPSGGYILEVEKVIKKTIGKEGGKQYPGYEWTFDIRHCDVACDDNNFRIFMFKSQMAELLRALDAVEVTKEVFEWDPAEVIGKLIACHNVHTDINGKMRDTLIEIKKHTDVVPQAKKTAEQVAWDE